jgi:hypothetical protein
VWPWQREPLLDREDVNAVIAFGVEMDAELDELLGLPRDEAEEEGPDT